MCGRYSLTNPQRILEAFPQFRFAEFSELRVPRYNIAPTQSVLGVRSGSVAIEGMRWGLLPPFAPQTPRITGLINARAETVASKPSFRDAFRHRRCILFADGFYEWTSRKPVRFTLRDERPFAFAGLWEPRVPA